MASAAPPDQQLRLHGPPAGLRLTSAALPKSGSGILLLPATAKGGAAVSVPARVVSRRQEPGQLRARLAQNTPPGTYAAQLEIAGEKYPIEVSVEPHERLTADPARSRFEGEPGAAAEIALTLSNRGNVAIDIPETIIAGIDDDSGLDEAFASAYRLDTNDAMKLLAQLILKLREGYGGLQKFNTVTGAGALAPGEQRAVTIKTSLPRNLKPGHSYHGNLKLGPLTHPFGINVHKRGGQK